MPQVSAENFPFVLAFVVPGFVAMKVYSLLNPAKRLDWSTVAVEVVSYGSINLALWWWLLADLHQPKMMGWIGPLSFVVFFASPVALALLASFIRRLEVVRRWIPHPLPTAWDFFFEQRRACWILFTLKDGSRFGGYFGKKSYASSYPEPPDLFVEDIWRVDEHGRFVDRIEGNLGTLVRFEDCRHVQLFRAEG